MAQSPWDFSNIILQNRAGEIMGQSIANLGQQVGQGLTNYYKKQEENKVFSARAKSIESTIKTHPELFGGKEQADQLLATDPNESPIARYSRLSDTLSNTVTSKTLGEMAQRQQLTQLQLNQAQQQEAARTQALRNIEDFNVATQAPGMATNNAKALAANPLMPYIAQVYKATGQVASPSDVNQYLATEARKTAATYKAGQIMTGEQIKDLQAKGFLVTATPAPGGGFNVTQVKTPSPLPPTVSLGAPAPGYSTTYDPLSGTATTKPVSGSPEIKAKEDAKSNLSNTLGSMMHGLVRLNDLGGAVNPENDITQNIGARIASSAIGQGAAGAIGTKAQTIRNSLKNAQPIVLAAIKKATGLTGTELNSNVELQFWMGQMGDDSQDIFTRLSALDALDRTYGSGTMLDSVLSENPSLLKSVREHSIQSGKNIPPLSGVEVRYSPDGRAWIKDKDGKPIPYNP